MDEGMQHTNSEPSRSLSWSRSGSHAWVRLVGTAEYRLVKRDRQEIQSFGYQRGIKIVGSQEVGQSIVTKKTVDVILRSTGEPEEICSGYSGYEGASYPREPSIRAFEVYR